MMRTGIVILAATAAALVTQAEAQIASPAATLQVRTNDVEALTTYLNNRVSATAKPTTTTTTTTEATTTAATTTEATTAEVTTTTADATAEDTTADDTTAATTAETTTEATTTEATTTEATTTEATTTEATTTEATTTETTTTEATTTETTTEATTAETTTADEDTTEAGGAARHMFAQGNGFSVYGCVTDSSDVSYQICYVDFVTVTDAISVNSNIEAGGFSSGSVVEGSLVTNEPVPIPDAAAGVRTFLSMCVVAASAAAVSLLA